MVLLVPLVYYGIIACSTSDMAICGQFYTYLGSQCETMIYIYIYIYIYVYMNKYMCMYVRCVVGECACMCVCQLPSLLMCVICMGSYKVHDNVCIDHDV